MKIVEFKQIDGRFAPLRPFPQSFFISSRLLFMDGFEARPLTVTGLIKGVGKNLITMTYWRALYGLYRTGFLAVPEAEQFSFRYWRWDFWNVLDDRRTAYLELRAGACEIAGGRPGKTRG